MELLQLYRYMVYDMHVHRSTGVPQVHGVYMQCPMHGRTL